MAISLYTKQDLKLVKKLINKNTTEEQFNCAMKYAGLSEIQVFWILNELRKEQGFRAFSGTLAGEPTLCNCEEYMLQNNYQDEIFTVEPQLSVIFAADAHLGDKLDCVEEKRKLNYIEMMQDFAETHNIRHIIFLGDLIEGVDYAFFHKKPSLKIHPDREHQLEYVNKSLPKMKKTTFHFLAGNHDIFAYNNISYDIAKDLKENFGRDDIVVSGFDRNDLKINNDKIKLIHNYKCFPPKASDPFFQFAGGSHISKVKTLENMYHRQVVPPLCRIIKNDKSVVNGREIGFYSGFLVVTFMFSAYNKIIATNTEFYRIDNDYNKPVRFNEEEFGVSRKRRKMRD